MKADYPHTSPTVVTQEPKDGFSSLYARTDQPSIRLEKWLRKVRIAESSKMGWVFTFAAGAYNLVRAESRGPASMIRTGQRVQSRYFARDNGNPRRQGSMNVFKANAAELEKLREKVNQTSRERSKSPEHAAVWEKAALAFHTEYDRLAFPGGLSREFELLTAGDVTAIEMAIRFLEADPWFFRSGYYKVDILKLLRKHPLSNEQCARMRKVILERVRNRPVREMRAYARFAPKVSTPQFEAEIANIAENANHQAARHAQWVIDCLKSARGTPRQR